MGNDNSKEEKPLDGDKVEVISVPDSSEDESSVVKYSGTRPTDGKLANDKDQRMNVALAEAFHNAVPAPVPSSNAVRTVLTTTTMTTTTECMILDGDASGSAAAPPAMRPKASSTLDAQPSMLCTASVKDSQRDTQQQFAAARAPYTPLRPQGSSYQQKPAEVEYIIMNESSDGEEDLKMPARPIQPSKPPPQDSPGKKLAPINTSPWKPSTIQPTLQRSHPRKKPVGRRAGKIRKPSGIQPTLPNPRTPPKQKTTPTGKDDEEDSEYSDNNSSDDSVKQTNRQASLPRRRPSPTAAASGSIHDIPLDADGWQVPLFLPSPETKSFNKDDWEDIAGIPVLEHRQCTLENFREIKKLVEEDTGASLAAVEQGRYIRQANHNLQASSEQTAAQYGRVLDVATADMFRLLELDPAQGDVFIDYGHGIGNAVLQAAYTQRCPARGIEVDENRFSASLGYAASFQDITSRPVQNKDGNGYIVSTVGLSNSILSPPPFNVLFPLPQIANVDASLVDLRLGGLEDPKHTEFLTGCGEGDDAAPPVRIKALCNNYAGVFANSKPSGSLYSLDHIVAGVFARTITGSKLVTLHKLSMPVSQAHALC